MKKRILVVDDDKDIVEILVYNLKKEDYKVKKAFNGKEAIEVARDFNPDLILMDIMMPEMDGIEAGLKIKSDDDLKDSHIIYLTARSEEFSEVAAFEAGADDFLTKPIKLRALMSRIKAHFKKNHKEEEEQILEIAGLKINREDYTVKKKNGEKIILPKKEFEILYLLAKKPNKVRNREQILEKVWGKDVFVVERTIDVHIRKVREKIGSDNLITLKGVGYMFKIDEK